MNSSSGTENKYNTKANKTGQSSLNQDPLSELESEQTMNLNNNEMNSSLIESHQLQILKNILKKISEKYLNKEETTSQVSNTSVLETEKNQILHFSLDIISKSLITTIKELRLKEKDIEEELKKATLNIHLINDSFQSENQNREIIYKLITNCILLKSHFISYSNKLEDFINTWCGVINKTKLKEKVILLKDENKNELIKFLNNDFCNISDDIINDRRMLYEEISLSLLKKIIMINRKTEKIIKDKFNDKEGASNSFHSENELINKINEKCLLSELEKEYKIIYGMFGGRNEKDKLVNIVIYQTHGIYPINNNSNAYTGNQNYEDSVFDEIPLLNTNSSINVITQENDNNANNNDHHSNYFFESIYFGVCFKLLHTTNVYLVQPNLNLYLEEIGLNEFDSGYVVALMHFAKLISCIWFSYWTNYSFKNPYYLAAFCMILSNISYALATTTQSKTFAYLIILLSRILIGFGSAKIIHKRMSIDFSTYYNLFFFAGLLMLVNNLGHALGPLLNLIIAYSINTSISSMSRFSLILPSISFIFVWCLLILYLKFLFKDPYDIKKELENTVEKKALNKIYKEERTQIQDQIVVGHFAVNQRPSIESSFNLHLVVLITAFSVYKGVIEFQLWVIPIIMRDVFGVGIVGYTIFTVFIMLLCK